MEQLWISASPNVLILIVHQTTNLTKQMIQMWLKMDQKALYMTKRSNNGLQIA